jgi:hypothetical protein
VKRFRQVADLQGWHEALKHRSTVGFMHALCMQITCQLDQRTRLS